MAQTIKLRRSGVEGSVPTTSQLALGEVAINTFDGRAFIHKSGSGPGAPPESIEHLITTNSETTGSINLIGSITASGDISGSGNLYANLSSNSSNYNTVVYNTSTGQFFYTGSYGGGGSGLTVGGTAGAIQYSDGAGALDFDNTFRIESSNNAISLGNALRLKTDISLAEEDISNNFSLRNRGLVFSSFQNSTGSFANFEGKAGHLMLYPMYELNTILTTPILNDHDYLSTGVPQGMMGSSRLHVIDGQENHVVKIINLNIEQTTQPSTLLLGTRRNAQNVSNFTPAFKFIDFQVNCGVHEGNSIGGIYYDPYGTQFASNANSVVYQGFFVQGSDKKLKKHITDTSRNIDDIMSMKVKDYRWKGSSRKSKKTTGLIAQDLQETHPELVSKLNNTLNVNYTNIVPMLIKAVQDQQKQIDDLKTQLENYKK